MDSKEPEQNFEEASLSSESDANTFDPQGKDQLWRPWLDIENRVPKFDKDAAQHRCPNPTCKEHAGFKRKPELRRHFHTQHMDSREECEHCGKVFTRKDNLTRHMKSAHDNKSKPECIFCFKPLSRKDAVNRHQVSCLKNPRKRKGDNQNEVKGKQSKIFY